MAATEFMENSIPKEGDILLGKYQVEKVLGVGGMGVVVAAQHVQLDEHVAIKFLLPEALGNQEAVARFTREARAAVKIKSEHVARVTDVGTLPEGTPYMVMEYLNGHDLSGELEAQGRLPIDRAVLYVSQACEAIAEAHTLGIIHRDLKPANLFLTTRPDGSPSVKVLDFGISKVSQGGGITGADMTRTTAIMGSPLYMSPEQMASTRNVDLRTDIYAIGVILHELMTGGPVFNADTMPQLCAMILQEPPPPLRNLRPEAPEELEQVILRCLHKDPAQRFPDVGELVAALAPFGPPEVRASAERIWRMIHASGQGTMGDRQSQMPGGAVTGPGATAATWADTKPPTEKKSKAPLIIAAVAAVAVLGVGGIVGAKFLLGGGQQEAAAQPDPAAEEAKRLAAEEKKKADELAKQAEEERKRAEELAKQIEEERKAARADRDKIAALEAQAEESKAEADKKAEASRAAAARAARIRPQTKVPKPVSRPTAAPVPKPAPAPAGADDLFSDRK